jgi:hypothetical protein
LALPAATVADAAVADVPVEGAAGERDAAGDSRDADPLLLREVVEGERGRPDLFVVEPLRVASLRVYRESLGVVQSFAHRITERDSRIDVKGPGVGNRSSHEPTVTETFTH